MKSKLAFLLLTNWALAQGIEMAPAWEIQIGVARSTAIDKSLDGQSGPSAEVHWVLPLSIRQDFQLRAGLTTVSGKHISVSLFGAPASPGLPPTYLGEGDLKSKASTQFFGMDYRVRFLQGDSTPYFVVGFLGGNVDYSQSVDFQGQSQKHSDRKFKGGISWGFGYRIGHRFAIDLRGHGYNSADNASSLVLGLSYKI